MNVQHSQNPHMTDLQMEGTQGFLFLILLISLDLYLCFHLFRNWEPQCIGIINEFNRHVKNACLLRATCWSEI